MAIPFIGLTANIELVMILILLERLGKALGSPSRDAVVSMVSKGVGAGKALGPHEEIDQTGAAAGSLILGGVMFYIANRYPVSFRILLVPYVLMLVALVFTYQKIGRGVGIEARSVRGSFFSWERFLDLLCDSSEHSWALSAC